MSVVFPFKKRNSSIVQIMLLIDIGIKLFRRKNNDHYGTLFTAYISELVKPTDLPTYPPILLVFFPYI